MIGVVICSSCLGGKFRSGGGWAYPFSVSKHIKDLFISLFSKNGNFFWITV